MTNERIQREQLKRPTLARMKHGVHWTLVLPGVLALMLVACGRGAETQVPTAVALALTETHVVTDFGFSIEYPSGWLALTNGTVTSVSNLKEGYAIRLVHQGTPWWWRADREHGEGRPQPFRHTLVIPIAPSLEDLLKVNAEYFAWQEPMEVSQTAMFGVPALRVRTQDWTGRWGDRLIGFVGDEAFLLSMRSPSEETLNEIMPTWTKMLESIKPVK